MKKEHDKNGLYFPRRGAGARNALGITEYTNKYCIVYTLYTGVSNNIITANDNYNSVQYY